MNIWVKYGGARPLTIVSNNSWTEWSTNQGVIVRVISKSDEPEVGG